MGIVSDVQRIGALERSPDNLVRRALKTCEEAGEVAEAALSVTSESKGKGKTWMDVVEEGCDVAIMGLDIAMTKPPGADISDEMWKEIVKKIFALKLEKWRKQVERKGTLINDGNIDFDMSELDVYLNEEPTSQEHVDPKVNGTYGQLSDAEAEQLQKEIDAGLHQ